MKQNACPISIKEFADALFKTTCQVPYRYDQRGYRTLGLAVSGGVDSMALAALCMQMKKNYTPFASDGYPINLDRIDFRAVIVNHGVRDGSLEEAQKVMGVLDTLGMTSRILTIPWEDVPGNPSKLPNFESLARKYRFQAMGRYCRNLDISSLLLGHHADDQAETILMRLANGARGVGLLGIKPSSPIPECEGIYGVHESGSPITLSVPSPDHTARIKPRRSYTLGELSKCTPANGIKKRTTQLEIESGGITLYRPLLGFPKERLIATCKALGVEWFEDDTNNDPTLTDRNAIRHLYEGTALPSVLPKSRVLALAAQLQNTDNLRQREVDYFIKKCKVTSFDTRRGTLIVRFPFIPDDVAQRSMVAAILLRRIIMTVTPNAVVSLDQILGAVSAIFPLSNHVEAPKPFNSAGVMFQPLKDQEFPGKYQWHMFREPRYRYSPDEVVVPTLLPQKKPRTFLYDNRYWLWIDNKFSSQAGDLVVRSFETHDVGKFGQHLGEIGSSIFKRHLRTVDGEDRWRYSLPVVVWRPRGGSVVGEETIVGLPSLGFKAKGFSLVKWECRYKKINLSDLGLEAAVEPSNFGVRRMMKLKGEVSDKPGFAPWLAEREKAFFEWRDIR
ncbi:hypothetical protein DSL72_007047 [Monilinia vaccinii-corymbosi]|uniref:tRNA(Ile)-lysidine synthetase n=1 Tax=Monilinia vaccinii-corymbosi TaxID=61207 RepID=A0A8A3PLS4_9HELO|nr:hypothetical protein DSL72_007047 [Monilinia vaccinii-corymbosi]